MTKKLAKEIAKETAPLTETLTAGKCVRIMQKTLKPALLVQEWARVEGPYITEFRERATVKQVYEQILRSTDADKSIKASHARFAEMLRTVDR
jgi:hypothetical protein